MSPSGEVASIVPRENTSQSEPEIRDIRSFNILTED